MNKKVLVKQLFVSWLTLVGILLGFLFSANAKSSEFQSQKPIPGSRSTMLTTHQSGLMNDKSGTIGTVPFAFKDGVVTLGGGTISSSDPIRSHMDDQGDPVTTIQIIGPITLKGEGSKGLFEYLKNLKSISGINNLDTSQATSFEGMFSNDESLTNLNLSEFRTDNVTDMVGMFFRDQSLTSLTISNFDTANVTDLGMMFGFTSSLRSIDVSHFDTSKATHMDAMFWGDSALTSIDVSHFNTNNVIKMSGMFGRDTSLTTLDLSNFDTRKINTTEYSDVVNMLYTLPSLVLLKIGPNVQFDAQKIYGKPGLGAPNGKEKWQSVSTELGGTLINPKGAILSPNELVALYDIANTNPPTKVETYVPEGGIPFEPILVVQPTYSIPAGTKFDPSKVFVSLTTLDGQVITNYQEALKAGMTVSGDQFDTNSVGTHAVTFNYFDKKATTQVTVTSSGGGGGGNVTPTPNPQPAPTPTPEPSPTPKPTPTEPAPPVEPTIPNYAAKKKAAAYAIKGIYLYKHATFSKSQRIATYPKQKRINRPMFVVVDYARSKGGALRYKVRDVNHGRKTAGKIGYITANWKFVRPVYYQSLPKNNKIRVISLKGVHAYKSKNLTERVKSYKKGTRLTVKKIVKHNLTTRYQLKNGLYITSNKKLVIHDQY